MVRINFYSLFVGLLALLVVESFLEGLPRSGPLIQLAFTGFLVVGVFSMTGEGWVFRAGLGLAATGFAAGVGYFSTEWLALRVVNLAAIVSFCLAAIAVMLRQVLFVAGAVTTNRLVGALCIYLLLGIAWASLYSLVEVADPRAFYYIGGEAGDPVEQLLYYSFVTLTTLGYGDIVPVHAVARTLAYLEAVVGQIYIAVLIAGLVGRQVAGTGVFEGDAARAVDAAGSDGAPSARAEAV